MTLICKFILWGSVLLFGLLGLGESSRNENLWMRDNNNCNRTIHVFFSSDELIRPMNMRKPSNGTAQDHLIAWLLREIVKIAKGKSQ